MLACQGPRAKGLGGGVFPITDHTAHHHPAAPSRATWRGVTVAAPQAAGDVGAYLGLPGPRHTGGAHTDTQCDTTSTQDEPPLAHATDTGDNPAALNGRRGPKGMGNSRAAGER